MIAYRVGITLIALLILGVTLVANYSSIPPLPFGIGRPDAGRLADETRAMLQKEYSADGDTSNLQVVSVFLTWKDGREYEGLAFVRRGGETTDRRINVDVLTDGRHVALFRAGPVLGDFSALP